MQRLTNLFLLLLLFVGVAPLNQQSASAQDAPRDVGYDRPANFSDLPVIRFRPSSGTGTDTARLNRVIARASATRTTISGGTVIRGSRILFTNGTFRLGEVPLMSNVHLRFGNNVRILANQARNLVDSSSIFRLQNGVRNVSVVGNSATNRVTIVGPREPDSDFEEGRFRAFSINDATNFLLSNLQIDNRFSRFSAISLISEGMGAAAQVDGPVPTRGTLSNINVINNGGGWGAIQIHACNRILATNISCVGGVTLRLETGIASVRGITDLDARNIRIRNGRAAITLQPHAVRSHNRIRLQNVVATGSTFAVEIRNGFVSSRDRRLGRPEFEANGEFQNLSIRNVTANFGTPGNAQIRFSSFRFLRPSDVASFIPSFSDFRSDIRINGDTLAGPPLGVILDEAIGYDPVISRVRSNDFPASLRTPRILTRDTPNRNDEGDRLTREFRDLESRFRTMRDAR